MQNEEPASSPLLGKPKGFPEDATLQQSLLASPAAEILRQQRMHQDESELSSFYGVPPSNLFKLKKRRKLPEVDLNRQGLIDEIWSDVKPFHIDQVTAEALSEPSSKVLPLKCWLVDNLKVLFMEEDREVLPWNAETHLALLKSEVTQLDLPRSFKWAGFRVMAVCVTLATEGAVQLGQILRCCYEHGVLEQPKDTEPQYYLEQILLV